MPGVFLAAIRLGGARRDLRGGDVPSPCLKLFQRGGQVVQRTGPAGSSSCATRALRIDRTSAPFTALLIPLPLH